MEQRPLEEEMMTLDVEQTSFPHQNFLHMVFVLFYVYATQSLAC